MATIGELAWDHMLTLTDRWNVGYSQPGRQAVYDGGTSDCSRSVAWAYNRTGMVKAFPDGVWTGSWRAEAAARGFEVIPYGNVGANAAGYVVGDLLLSEGASGGTGHIAMVGPGGRLAEFWVAETGGIDGRPGDQTGTESRSDLTVYTHPYRNRWTHILRPPGTEVSSIAAEVAAPKSIEEDTMRLVREIQTGRIWAVTPLDVSPVDDAKTWDKLSRAYDAPAGGYHVDLDSGDITLLRWEAAARRGRLASAVASGSTVDAASLAAQIAPALVAPLTEAISQAGGTGLAAERVREATEQAIRSVFATIISPEKA